MSFTSVTPARPVAQVGVPAPWLEHPLILTSVATSVPEKLRKGSTPSAFEPYRPVSSSQFPIQHLPSTARSGFPPEDHTESRDTSDTLRWTKTGARSKRIARPNQDAGEPSMRGSTRSARTGSASTGKSTEEQRANWSRANANRREKVERLKKDAADESLPGLVRLAAQAEVTRLKEQHAARSRKQYHGAAKESIKRDKRERNRKNYAEKKVQRQQRIAAARDSR